MKNSKFGNWDLPKDKLPYRIKSVYLCELAFEPDPVIGRNKSDKKKTQLYLCDLEKLKDALKGEIDGKRK